MKARITITTVVEYDFVEDAYEGCTTFEEMLALDLKNAEEDPAAFEDMVGAKTQIKGELIQD